MGDAAVAVFHDTAVAARKTAHGLNGFAVDVAHDTKAGVRHFAHVAEKESSKAYNLVRDFVEDRPKASIGLVAGLAVIVGVILWRRRERLRSSDTSISN
jgi:ElaB/YqjD/DUF883 family membrane-anchored ribosome-binding protein